MTYWTDQERKHEGDTADEVLRSVQKSLVAWFSDEYVADPSDSVQTFEREIDIHEIDESGETVTTRQGWATLSDFGFYEGSKQ